MLQKPLMTLEAYYDFWARMEDASKNDATFFSCVLAQKMLSADKRAATGADARRRLGRCRSSARCSSWCCTTRCRRRTRR